MIRSMTGYGDAEVDCPAGRLRLEVKTVNHRFFNPSVKTPSGFDRFEAGITEALKAKLPRGHVSAFLSIDRSLATDAAAARVDLERARAYLAGFAALREELGVAGEVDLATLASFSDIFRPVDTDRTAGVEQEVVNGLAEQAAEAALRMREDEGLRLEADLRERLTAIGSLLDGVEARAPERLKERRGRLKEAVRELSDGVDIDDDRLAREIGLLAEKWDVNEEVVRFRSHVELFEEALEGAGTEPVGKRLGFLVQEMHREANTVGSKANDATVTELSVALKEEVEKIREQVENVE